MGSWCPRVVFFSFIPAACYDFCGFCLPKSERKCHQLNLVWLSHNGQVKRSGKKLLTKEIFLQVSRQIHKHVHVCTHQIVSRSTFVSFKALKEAWVNRNSEIQEMPGIYLLLLAPPDGCPITNINAKPVTENVADGCISGSSSHSTPTEAVLGHPPTLRSGK